MTSTQPSVAFLQLLAHEVRWQIIDLLKQSDLRVQEIVQAVGHPQNFVSYHLKQLRDFHLVTERRSDVDRRDIYYSLDTETLAQWYHQTGVALHPLCIAPKTAIQPPIASTMSVLFLCTHNSARSQMAEGLLRNFTHERVTVTSAGTDPRPIDPLTIATMDHLGIAIQRQFPKAVHEVMDRRFTHIITVCDRAREHCPEFPTVAQYTHWSIPDPLGHSKEVFAATAQQLSLRIRAFLRLEEPAA